MGTSFLARAPTIWIVFCLHYFHCVLYVIGYLLFTMWKETEVGSTKTSPHSVERIGENGVK